MSMYKRIFVFAAVVGLLLASAISVAAEGTEPARRPSLALSFVDGDRGIPGGVFSVWKIADLTAGGTAAPSGRFAAAPVSFDDLTAEGLTNLALTLSGYVLREGVAPLQTGVTDAAGRLAVDSASTPGLYLVTGETLLVGDAEYRPSPFIVTVTGDQARALVSEVKYTTAEQTQPRLTELTIQKIWRDDGQHPAEITVEIFHNGASIKTVALNAENHWRCAVTDLPDSGIYTVAEAAVPAQYRVLVKENGSVFTITNTKTDGSGEQTTAPTPSAEPTPPSATPPSSPSGSGNSGKLPQTGTLLWLVPVLLAVGGAIFGAGVIMKKKAEND